MDSGIAQRTNRREYFFIAEIHNKCELYFKLLAMSYLTKSQQETVTAARNSIRALRHPLRQQMMALIKDAGNRLKVTDIYKKMRIEQSVASMHLAILRRGGFLKTKRDGRIIWYSVDDARVKAFIKALEK